METGLTGKTVCVVGHGLSLRGANLGNEIDKHIVVRVGKGLEILGHDYGHKTDYTLSKDGFRSRLVAQAGEILETDSLLEEQHHWNMSRNRYRGLSNGFRAIWQSCYMLRPSNMLLAGCDNLWAGTPVTAGYKNVFGTNVDQSNAPPFDCDYAREKQLLREVETRYGVLIASLELYLACAEV